MLTILQSVLNEEELQPIRQLLTDAPFADGRQTAGANASAVKHNLQLPPQSPQAVKIADIALKALHRHHLFIPAALPFRIHPPIVSRYQPGMTYGRHVDNAVMGSPLQFRTDVSLTLFINPPESYDGGELTISDTFGNQRIKLAAGDAVLYPSSSLHGVEPLSRGTRDAVVIWMQSLVRDPAQRRLLFDIERTVASMSKRGAPREETDMLALCYHNLLRMWAET